MYCSKCGSQISADAVLCAACGQPVGRVAPSAQSSAMLPVMSPPAAYAPAAYPGTIAAASSTRVLYAGFWLRFVAFLIDSVLRGFTFVVLLIPLLVLSGAGAALSQINSSEDVSDQVAAAIGVSFVLGFIGIVLLVSWLYYALFESSSWQATPGKKMLNLYVTDLAGQPITFARASGRFFAKFISGPILSWIGYIVAGFTEKKQAIHDMLAGCLVLRSS